MKVRFKDGMFVAVDAIVDEKSLNAVARREKFESSDFLQKNNQKIIKKLLDKISLKANVFVF